MRRSHDPRLCPIESRIDRSFRASAVAMRRKIRTLNHLRVPPDADQSNQGAMLSHTFSPGGSRIKRKNIPR
jgi:hypothetical protein